MDLGKLLENLMSNPPLLKRIGWATLALVVVIDFFLPRPYLHFFWDSIPGFSAVYGLFSCILIIVVSKALGKLWLSKPEDYYDD
jgi:hypothetical protein